MADDAPTPDAEAPNAEATEAPDPDKELLSQADDPDAVRKALQREREAAKEAKRRADEFAAKVAEFEDRDKTETQKLSERAQSAEERATQAEMKALRFEVAVKKGLTGERAALANRLQGNTKEELEADADQLLTLLAEKQETSFDGGPRGTPASPRDMDSLIRGSLSARRG